MKVTFLGSAAAEGIPFPYCDCGTCTHARKHKGKNIRKRCSYLINDDLIIDMGPDLFAACAQHDVDLLAVKYALITHSHMDHFHTQTLKLRAQHFRLNTELPRLTLVGGPSTMLMLNQSGAKDKNMELNRVPILPYDKVELPPYKIKSLKANHFPRVGDAMNFIIDDGETKILLASDTGIYEDEVWAHLENEQLDLVIIEATKGDLPSNKIHLNIEDVNHMLQKMREIGAIKDSAAVYATHFGHQHCPPHEELSDMLEAEGMHCVYDGLVVKV